MGIIAAAAIVAASSNVQAGDGDLVFVDVFGGYIWNKNQDVELEFPSSLGNVDVEINDVGVEDVAGFGGRLGFWFQSHPSIGFAIDATHFDSDVDTQTINGSVTVSGTGMTTPLPTQAIGEMRVATTLVTFDLLFRHRMGQFTPYITAGAGVGISELDENNFFTVTGQGDTDHSLAVKAGAGLSFALSDTLEFFGEYRFMYADPEYDLKDIIAPNLLPAGEFNRGTLEKDIEAHTLFTGISIRF